MSSTLRRLSASLPFISKPTADPTPTTETNSEPTTSLSRRKSSVTSISSTSDPTTFRSLGARDYKLAMDPEEEKERRLSVAAFVADMSGVKGEGGRKEQEQDGEGEEEDVMVVRRGSKGRIYGARDWRMIGQE